MPFVTATSKSVPQLIEIGGRPTLTSIVREPQPGPLRFDLGGPEGNRTAVHTEEVLATTRETYTYWSKQLDIRRDRWPDCFWGENLTLSGLDEPTLAIGDRLEIGRATVFEVTSPRIPCFKLAWRLGQPENFLRALVKSGRTGFYLRVIAPGQVTAGDEVTLIRCGRSAPTVAEISLLLHEEGVDPERLRMALATPALGRQAATMLRNRIIQLTEGTRSRRGRWSGWRRFTVSGITQESATTRSFFLKSADGAELAQSRPGQFLAVRLPLAAGRPLVRTWSLSDYAEAASDYRITVRRQSGGRGSTYLHDNVKIGDVVEARSPTGGFVLDRSTICRITLISAGIGVTPLVAMLKAHALRNDPPPLLWIHSTRNRRAHVLHSEVEAILRAHPRFSSHIRYTAPGPEDVAGIHFDEVGRLTPERLIDIVGENYSCSPFGREIELPSKAGLFYVCGPPAFEAAVRKALVEFGVEPSAIQSESFGRSISIEHLVASCRVTFRRSGKAAIWNSETDMSLLELAEQTGIGPPSSCRAGYCHTCETGLLSGAVSYAMEPALPPTEGRVLICCARPASEALELDL